MDVITQYVLPKSTLPRYMYAVNTIHRLNKRCQKRIRKCGLNDVSEITKFGDVILNIRGKPNETLLTPDELITGTLLGDLQSKVFREGDFRHRDGPCVHSNQPVVWVTTLSSEIQNSLPDYFGPLGMIVCPNESINKANRLLFLKVTNNRTGYSTNYLIRTTRQDFAKELNNLLELYVMWHIKQRTKVLKQILLTVDIGLANVQTREYAESLLRKLNKITNTAVPFRTEFGEGDAIVNLEDLRVNIVPPATEPRSDMDQMCSNNSPFSESVEKHLEALQSDTLIKKVKDVLTEITATFMRSNVPRTEWPTNMEPPRAKEELPREIFDKIPGAINCGYRLGTFQVVVDETVNTMSEEEIKERVAHVLRRQDNQQPVSCVVRYSSGATLDLDGGCAVSPPYVGRNETVTNFSSAGNRIHKFKNEQGKARDCLVYDFQEKKIETLVGLPVYLWNWSSRLSKGIIRTPELFMPGRYGCVLKVPQIEEYSDSDSDSDDGACGGISNTLRHKHFATEQDKRTIVCHQDPDDSLVHLIAELSGIGSIASRRGDTSKRTYFSWTFK